MGQLRNEDELLKWLKEVDILFRLAGIEAKVVLGYLEGSGYSLETEGSELYLKDDVNETRESITIDDAVDQACESNYELIEETVEKIASSDMGEDTMEQEQYLLELIQDEKVLDKVFEQTRYYKAITEKVAALPKEKTLVSAEMQR